LLRERENYQEFAEISQFGPAYRGGADHDGWHMALLDYVEPARTVPPWTDDALDQTFALIARLHRSTPPNAKSTLRPLLTAMAEQLQWGWGSLCQDPTAKARFLSLFADNGAAHHWLRRHGDRLAELERAPLALAGPQAWLHMDIRSDNLVFADRPVLVDWPSLVYGSPLIDVAGFLPSLEAEGGPGCAQALERYQAAAKYRHEKSDTVTAAAFVSGYFAARAGEAEIAGLPRLRQVQRRQLQPALRWLCDLLDIEQVGRLAQA